ncbi:hypothetical protein WG66_011573 [Moniliophthora roreri]|nr:hypothetical protein WG66_011573 [Moniliophthora roreri]
MQNGACVTVATVDGCPIWQAVFPTPQSRTTNNDDRVGGHAEFWPSLDTAKSCDGDRKSSISINSWSIIGEYHICSFGTQAIAGNLVQVNSILKLRIPTGCGRLCYYSTFQISK